MLDKISDKSDKTDETEKGTDVLTGVKILHVEQLRYHLKSLTRKSTVTDLIRIMKTRLSHGDAFRFSGDNDRYITSSYEHMKVVHATLTSHRDKLPEHLRSNDSATFVSTIDYLLDSEPESLSELVPTESLKVIFKILTGLEWIFKDSDLAMVLVSLVKGETRLGFTEEKTEAPSPSKHEKRMPILLMMATIRHLEDFLEDETIDDEGKAKVRFTLGLCETKISKMRGAMQS